MSVMLQLPLISNYCCFPSDLPSRLTSSPLRGAVTLFEHALGGGAVHCTLTDQPLQIHLSLSISAYQCVRDQSMRGGGGTMHNGDNAGCIYMKVRD